MLYPVPELPDDTPIENVRLPLMKCSRRIRAIVSSISIPNHLLYSKAGCATGQTIGGALPHPECYWTTSRR